MRQIKASEAKPGMSPQYQPWGSPFTRVIDARASAPGAA